MNIFSKDFTTSIKSIAILLVVLCHVGRIFTRAASPLGGIGVALFLILSAYGLEKSFLKSGLKAFWRKRLITVFVPYWIIELIAYLTGLTQIGGGYLILLDLTLIKPRFGLGWYLNYLLLWYVIFWLIHKIPLFADNKKYRVLAFAIVSIALPVYFNFTSSLRFEQSFSFLTGIWLANYDEELCTDGVKIRGLRITKDSLMKLPYGITALVLAFVILAAKQTGFVREQSDTVLNIVDLGINLFSSIGILVCVFAFDAVKGWVSKFRNLIKRILTPVGMASLELYLVHGYALSVFSVEWSKGLCVLVFLAISIVGTVVFHMFNSWLGKTLRAKLRTEKISEAV